jgi:hypothetical protein
MTLCLSAQALAEDVESPKDDIAAQIRAQGYACDQPQSATRDAQASKPDEEVWLLRCEGASYRVRLIPDMAAQVERIRSISSRCLTTAEQKSGHAQRPFQCLKGATSGLT